MPGFARVVAQGKLRVKAGLTVFRRIDIAHDGKWTGVVRKLDAAHPVLGELAFRRPQPLLAAVVTCGVDEEDVDLARIGIIVRQRRIQVPAVGLGIVGRRRNLVDLKRNLRVEIVAVDIVLQIKQGQSQDRADERADQYAFSPLNENIVPHLPIDSQAEA